MHGSLLHCNEPDVRRVVGQDMALHRGEAGSVQHVLRGLPAPHGAETGAALAQGYRCAVGAGHGIEQRCQGEIEIVLQLHRAADILHQVGTAGPQGAVQGMDQTLRVLLVVVNYGDTLLFAQI